MRERVCVNVRRVRIERLGRDGDIYKTHRDKIVEIYQRI